MLVDVRLSQWLSPTVLKKAKKPSGKNRLTEAKLSKIPPKSDGFFLRIVVGDGFFWTVLFDNKNGLTKSPTL